MILYIGADHRGFDLKEDVKKHLQASGYDVMDVGNLTKDESDDYPEFAKKIAVQVGADSSARKGILFCGSGAGMAIVANKFPGIRSCVVMSADHAMAIKEEDDVNVLCIASDFTGADQAKKIIAVWLQAFFKNEERYIRRIEQVRQIEVDQGMWK